MEQTTNYQLSQWDEKDRILREDFNADNAKTEQALAEQAEAQSQMAAVLAKYGNCKIVYGSYIGTGTCGSGNPNKLTFDHKPLLVFVQGRNNSSETADYYLRLVRESVWSIGTIDNYCWSQKVTWGDTSVEWYGASSTVGTSQFNEKSTVYYYVALLAADE